MAINLGKRKRDDRPESQKSKQQNASSDEEDVKARFARAFQAKFAPLEKKSESKTARTRDTDVGLSKQYDEQPDEQPDEQADDDWIGLSDDEAEIEVVNVQSIMTDTPDVTRDERKSFMSTKMPIAAVSVKRQTKQNESESDDDNEASNVKNDVALQRLLKESHLFQPGDSRNLDLQGKSRLKALDLRLQDLGAKDSHLAQAEMPLSHHRGIKNKAIGDEKRRRKDASENGIILERAKSVNKATRPREKGIGGPSIGKFRGGMLSLSGRDLKSIEHGRSNNSKRKR